MTSFRLANTPFAGGIARKIARGLGGVAVGAVLWSPTCVAAQSIHGVVLDAESGNPNPAAEVRLLGRGDSAIAQYTTRDDGRFSFRTPRAGSYRLRASRIGYSEHVTGAFRADVSHDASVELRLQVEPARLPPLGVGVEAREDLLDRVGFYKRMARGIGYFRSPEDLKAMGLEFSAALFDGIPGIRANDSAVVSLSHASGMSRCPLHVAVDGVVIAGSWREIVDPHEVLALEVYPRPTGLPVWLAGSVSPCGAVVIWTKR